MLKWTIPNKKILKFIKSKTQIVGLQDLFIMTTNKNKSKKIKKAKHPREKKEINKIIYYRKIKIN